MPNTPALTPQQLTSRKETVKSLRHRAKQYLADNPARSASLTAEADRLAATLPAEEPAPAPHSPV
jgi:hypothetical protein